MIIIYIYKYIVIIIYLYIYEYTVVSVAPFPRHLRSGDTRIVVVIVSDASYVNGNGTFGYHW